MSGPCSAATRGRGRPLAPNSEPALLCGPRGACLSTPVGPVLHPTPGPASPLHHLGQVTPVPRGGRGTSMSTTPQSPNCDGAARSTCSRPGGWLCPASYLTASPARRGQEIVSPVKSAAGHAWKERLREPRHHTNTERWARKDSEVKSSWCSSRRAHGGHHSQPRQEDRRSPEQGQKPDWRRRAQAAKLQPSPQADTQATGSLRLVETVS